MLRAVSCIPIENATSHPVVYRLASLGVEPSPGVSYDRFMHTGPGAVAFRDSWQGSRSLENQIDSIDSTVLAGRRSGSNVRTVDR